MNVQEILHRLVDALDCKTAKQQLHAVVDELNEKQSDSALERLRATRHMLETLGFYT